MNGQTKHNTKASIMDKKYFLLDANITAAYYLPRSIRSKKAANNIEIILNHIRSFQNHFLYIPNFCIAETFSVFMKHTFGHWNRHVRKHGAGKRTIDKRIYQNLVKSFETDIHNGKFMYHYELNRYHILGINLVAPIDHYYQMKRKKNVMPAGTFDHLIISMGVHLAHIHGRENVCILTADQRMSDLLDKCKSEIKKDTIRKLKLRIAEEVCGKPFSGKLFPHHLNLAICKERNLKEVFGTWPLESNKKCLKSVYRWTK